MTEAISTFCFITRSGTVLHSGTHFVLSFTVIHVCEDVLVFIREDQGSVSGRNFLTSGQLNKRSPTGTKWQTNVSKSRLVWEYSFSIPDQPMSTKDSWAQINRANWNPNEPIVQETMLLKCACVRLCMRVYANRREDSDRYRTVNHRSNTVCTMRWRNQTRWAR